MKQPDRQLTPFTGSLPVPEITEPRKELLANGAEVYLFEDSEQQAVRFDLIADAGSVYQHKLLTASTVIEMLREGTTRHNGNSIHSRFEYHGAFLNPQASRDSVMLSVFCLEKSLHRLLPLVAELWFQPVFPEKAFQRYIQQRKQQFILAGKRNRLLASRLFTKMIYGIDSLYGQSAEEEDFDRISTNDLIEFHQKYYVKGNYKIVLSGAISDKLLQKINLLFGQHTLRYYPALTKAFITNAEKGIFKNESSKSLQSAIVMGRQVMPHSHPDFSAFMILITILGGYFGSRLMRNIREDKGFTYGINASLAVLRKATTLSISTEVGTEVTQQSLNEIRKELLKLMNEPIGADELQLVKNYLSGSYLGFFDGVFKQSDTFRSALNINRKMSYFSDLLETIQIVTPQRLQNLANNWLQPDDMLTVLVGK